MTTADTVVDAPPRADVLPGGGGRWFTRPALHTILIIVCLIWLLPTVSLFVSSLRPANEVLTAAGGTPSGCRSSSRSTTTGRC